MTGYQDFSIWIFPKLYVMCYVDAYRWFVCCCQTGRQTPRLETTVGGEPSSTCLHRWPLTCRRREWSPHRELSQTTRTRTAAVGEDVAGGFPESSRAIWTRCGSWTHPLRQQRREPWPGGPRGGCRGSRLWAGWTPGCIEDATEPRSSTAPPSGTLGRWEEERNSPAALSEPDHYPTCLDKVKQLRNQRYRDINQLTCLDWQNTVYSPL